MSRINPKNAMSHSDVVWLGIGPQGWEAYLPEHWGGFVNCVAMEPNVSSE